MNVEKVDQTRKRSDAPSFDPPPEPSFDPSASLAKWWLQEKEKLSQGEILRFLQENKGRLETSLASIHHRDILYRMTNSLFALFAVIAGYVDRIKHFCINLILRIPAPKSIKGVLGALIDSFSFRGIIDFFSTKLYSLRKAPHNIRAMQLMDDIIAFATKNGLDFKQHFPEIGREFLKRKNQLLQHSFFTEFTKSRLEKLLAIPFAFHRSITPVLTDSALWHKFYVFLEKRNIIDIILVGDEGQRVSLTKAGKNSIDTSPTVRMLYQASVLKSAGRRIFIIGHHEGYLGPYFVRSVLRRLGFDNLAANCNTVVGPRMFSNLVLKSGASNVGNLFLTLPSQKTTQVKEKGLATELLKNARRTQFLIKMPDAGLKLIEQMTYTEFMQSIVHFDLQRFISLTAGLEAAEREELRSYLQATEFNAALIELDSADYNLFKEVMHEPFLLFPEGSRSYNEDNGDVTMKYVNPRFMQAYLRPGDVILPINLVGGSDITNGWRLSPATLGVSVGTPYEVSAQMIENYEVEGLKVMRTIAALPNIKNVHFDEDIQAGKKFSSKAAA